MAFDIEFQFTPLREGRLVGKVLTGVQSVISIHAPPRGATPPNQRNFRAFCNFNSRPSARGDDPSYKVLVALEISIHAPPRGATRGLLALPSLSSYFNSRPSARGDKVAVHATVFFKAFQFTPLREGRLDKKPVFTSVGISIHAPPRGATRACSARKQAIGISIHAPPRGATNRSLAFHHSVAISIHAPPRGATWRNS